MKLFKLVLILFLYTKASECRKISESDSQRPQYHFMPIDNWMNDPNGPMYYNGFYHIFYQYNPTAAVWGDMHWGHAVSTDLIHWEHLPIALSPDMPYDKGGVFSGSATLRDDDEGPILIFTGVYPEVQCIAVPSNLSDPFLTNWTKISNNPVIAGPPANLQLTGFRDPTTAWLSQDGFFYILVGSGIQGQGGATLLYRSEDLFSWTYVHPFAQDQESQFLADTVWECPDFYYVDNTFLFKYSTTVTRKDIWNLGYYEENSQKFTVQTRGLYDYGIGVYYASKTFYDSKHDRRVLWGWVTENDDQKYWIQRGWAGVQTIPREVTIGNDGLPRFNPVREVEVLRQSQWTFNNVELSNSVKQLNGVSGNQLEIIASISEFHESVVGFNIAVSPNHTEYTSILFQQENSGMTGFDLPGNDYWGIELGQADPTLCKKECDNDNYCFAWTYTEPGMKGPNAWCFLKQNIGPFQPNSQCTSGLKSLMVVNRTNSGLEDVVTVSPVLYTPYNADVDTLNVRIFIDHSLFEVFVNGGQQVLSGRIYPSTTAASQSIELVVEGSATFDQINVWTLSSSE